MGTIRAGGQAAARAQLDGIVVAGRRLERVQEVGTLLVWRARLAPARLLEVSVSAGGEVLSTSVGYRSLQPARMTQRQARAAALQAAFYSRYEAIGVRAFRSSAKPRLPADERLILMIGELEADVSNGGFHQYLLNKGRRRARAALGALLAIGARTTARWLESALDEGVAAETLERLDARFDARREDLACLVMRHLDRPGRRPRGRPG